MWPSFRHGREELYRTDAPFRWSLALPSLCGVASLLCLPGFHTGGFALRDSSVKTGSEASNSRALLDSTALQFERELSVGKNCSISLNILRSASEFSV